MYTEIDKSKCKVGVVTEIYKGEGKTGYQIQMLIRGKEYIYDVLEDIYDEIDKGRYGRYPCITEYLYIPVFNEDGVVQQLLIDDYSDRYENGLFETHLEFGTYAMFKYLLTEDAPKGSDLFRIEGNKLIFHGLSKHKDRIIALSYSGAMPEPKDSMTLKLADDLVVYVWDWSQALKPFSITCTREEAIANKFVTRFQVGTKEDINDGHWIDLVCTRENEKEIDTAIVFKNVPPGWTFE